MADFPDQNRADPADSLPVRAKGRGAQSAPANRFGLTHVEADLEHVEYDEEYLEDLRNIKTDYLPDTSKSIISENDSPDLPFHFSLNPYRDCLHGCLSFVRYREQRTKMIYICFDVHQIETSTQPLLPATTGSEHPSPVS